MTQSGSFTNNTCEAYTENSLGRKESRTFLKQFSSENENKSEWRQFERPGSQYKRIIKGEILEGSSESKSVAWGKRNVQEPRRPHWFLDLQGAINATKKKVVRQQWGVRSHHSNQRTGEPFTR